MQSSGRKVQLDYKGNLRSLFVTDNCLKRKTIEEYFTKECTVTYTSDNETFLLESNETHFYLQSDVDIYNIVPKDDSSRMGELSAS